MQVELLVKSKERKRHELWHSYDSFCYVCSFVVLMKQKVYFNSCFSVDAFRFQENETGCFF